MEPPALGPDLARMGVIIAIVDPRRPSDSSEQLEKSQMVLGPYFSLNFRKYLKTRATVELVGGWGLKKHGPLGHSGPVALGGWGLKNTPQTGLLVNSTLVL